MIYAYAAYACLVYTTRSIYYGSHLTKLRLILLLIHHNRSHKQKQRTLSPIERESLHFLKNVFRLNMWHSQCLWLFWFMPLSHTKGHPNSWSDTLGSRHSWYDMSPDRVPFCVFAVLGGDKPTGKLQPIVMSYEVNELPGRQAGHHH